LCCPHCYNFPVTSLSKEKGHFVRFHRSCRYLYALWAALLVLSVLPSLSLSSTVAQASPAMQDASGKLVLAFYYTWFMPADFERGQMLDHPLASYNSSLPETMDRQVREAKDAGIDAFILSWSGQGTDTDANFGRLLDIAQ